MRNTTRSFRLLGPLARFLTVGLLPPRVREQYGYRWNATCECVLEAMASATKRLLPAIPAVIRVAPHARAAERQLRLLGRARQTA